MEQQFVGAESRIDGNNAIILSVFTHLIPPVFCGTGVKTSGLKRDLQVPAVSGDTLCLLLLVSCGNAQPIPISFNDSRASSRPSGLSACPAKNCRSSAASSTGASRAAILR